MKVRILKEAIEDLKDGFHFYEAQNSGLGDYFLNTLFSDIDSLSLYAGIHQKYHGYQRFLSKRFPYAIYYVIEGVSFMYMLYLTAVSLLEISKQGYHPRHKIGLCQTSYFF